MSYKSIMKGLNEAVEISEGKLKGRKRKISIAPVEEFTNTEIRKIRNDLGLTQVMFAQLLGVSIKTVESWETGTNSPNGSAKRILGLLKEDLTLPEKYNLISKAE